MLRAAVIEKNAENRKIIEAAVGSLNMDINISLFSNVYDLKEKLDEKATSFDIFLLNTSISKEGDGIELARFIRNKNRRAMLCFITESRDYYAQAFDLLATGYILYPMDPSKLQNAINFFYQNAKNERRKSIMIKERAGNWRRIFSRDILYLESANREVLFHMSGGTTISSYGKLDDAMEKLSDDQFARCHQGYAVNMYYVEEIQAAAFVVDGEQVPISRKYKLHVREIYHNYMLKNK